MLMQDDTEKLNEGGRGLCFHLEATQKQQLQTQTGKGCCLDNSNSKSNIATVNVVFEMVNDSG